MKNMITEMKLSKYLHIILIIPICLILGTVLIETPELANSEVIGQMKWFHGSLITLATGSLIIGITQWKKLAFSFSVADICVIILGCLLTVTYDFNFNPAPDKLYFLLGLTCLWFILRILFDSFPILNRFSLWMIICLGGIEAIIGLRQIYGFTVSNHSLYSLTGTFFNPGPYSGYLAMILPICLSKMPEHKKTYYILLGCIILFICILPAGMSRSAWIASSISCLWIAWKQFSLKEKLRKSKAKNKKAWTGLYILCITLITIMLVAIFFIKKDSANGRLFMWKISTKAVISSPIKGYGIGGFPANYGKEQAKYFAENNYSQTEEQVAGSPEYAFNEYLQIGMEGGLITLAAFLFLLIWCFQKGVQKREYAACGGILSLSIFSFASYPLQLPPFPVTLVFLLSMCVSIPDSISNKNMKSVYSYIILCIFTSISIYIYPKQKEIYRATRKWSESRILYNVKSYDVAKDKYQGLYNTLKHRAPYLFEYGQILTKTNETMEADSILKRASLLCADPMIHNVMGKNYQLMKQYDSAEKEFIYAIHLLPGRLYPYYLLTKLYNEPDYYNKEKLKETGQIVLTKEVKVQSTAVRQMRNEIKNLIEKQ